MTTRTRFTWSRAASLALAAGLLFALAGDRSSVAAGPRGIDPLDVLDLQVKPNVIVVLDSSGSMQESLGVAPAVPPSWRGDWQQAKISLAKTVLSSFFQTNSTKASFLFGQYDPGTATMNNTGLGLAGGALDTGQDRFLYMTYADWHDNNGNKVFNPPGDTLEGTGGLAPSMLTPCAAPFTTACELTMLHEPPTPNPVSITITPGVNDRLEWTERVTTAAPLTYAYCIATLTAGTYTGDAGMTALAAVVTSKMVPGACIKYTPAPGIPSPTAVANSFTAAWNAATGQFTLTRVGAARYQMRFAAPAGAAASLGWGAANIIGATPAAPIPSPGPTNTNITATTMGNANWTNNATVITGTTLGTPSGAAAGTRGFQAWQFITTGWNKLYFTEGVACTATITPGFYQHGQDLANEIALRMNSCVGRPAVPNVYVVTYAQATGKFTFNISPASTKNFTLLWKTGAPNNIAGALSNWSSTTGTPAAPVFTDASVTAGTAYTTINNSLELLRRVATTPNTAVQGGTGTPVETAFDPDGTGPLPPRERTSFVLSAARFFNGELFYVHGDGSICNVDFASPVKTNPPSIRLQQLSDCNNLASTVGSVVKFEFAGGQYGGNGSACNGFVQDVKLVACNSASNVPTILPFLDKEFPIDGVAANPTFGAIKGYAERQDGTFGIQTLPAVGGIKANGSTPIAESLIDIRTIFGTSNATGLWGFGQAAPSRAPINNQASPRERTIILFVTDGNDTCPNGGSGTNDNALRAAHKAQQLFTPIDATKPESSVTSYIIGLGTGASKQLLDWIAWGGSGLGQGQPGQPAVATTGAGSAQRWDGAVETPAVLQSKRNLCSTCVDSFFAPDAATLAATLQSLLDQGASAGEFTAQQAVFAPVFELVKEVTVAPNNFDPEAPNTRYNAVVPNLFRSSFDMPGFKGSLKAFEDTAGQVSLKWNAGTKLFNRVSVPIATCAEAGAAAGQCLFSTLQTKINRRIFTTSRNGVFPTTIGNLTDTTWLDTNGNRTLLWPPPTSVAPNNNTAPGILDAALGLPTADTAATLTALQTQFGACSGTGVHASCLAAAGVTAQAQRARREAREMILAFNAGAQVKLDAVGKPTHQVGTGEVLYVSRTWVLADSTLATPAMIGPPIEPAPKNDVAGFDFFSTEYVLFRDGFRDVDGKATGDGTRIGFGLRNPDKDADHTSTAPDTTLPNLKPAMSVVYVGANDMLHAFRAGPNCNVPGTFVAPPGTPPPFSGFLYTACAEQGGEELWGFVPFDLLGKIRQTMVAQTRANHTYMLAAGLRFADVFVPNPGTASDRSGTTTITIGTKTETVNGVWRRLLVFGRGQGGKYVTALDVTTPGNYKTLANNTVPPVVYWSRGNIDSQDGTAAGANNNTLTSGAADRAAYARMGETWSVPTIGLVDRTLAVYQTTRKPAGIDFAIFMGSGYGDTSGCAAATTPCEGSTFFTLDALTGDVVASVDVGQASPLPAGGYANAIVANVAAFNSGEFVAAQTGSVHPAASRVDRLYVGDTHGRLWKFLATAPGSAIELSNFGVDQPIAAPVSLLGLDDGSGNFIPHVYVTTGFDNRADPAVSGAFLIAGIKDDLAGAPATPNNCLPTVTAPCLFVRDLSQTLASGTVGFFRGSVQPSTLLTDSNPSLGRVFFAGTRFNPPNSEFAPPPCTILGCNPVVPCRSSFDSIVFALGAITGDAAFNLNDTAGVDDSYVIFDNSKIAGLTVIAAPDSTGKSEPRLYIDEGLNRNSGSAEGSKPTPDELPGGGLAPSTAGTAGVSMALIRSSSTVCQ